MKPWYEELFENYGGQYDKESFTQGTIGECDFIEKELNHNRSLTIIDVGCGTGRHAIELTKRGYSVTGIDLSEAQLRKAREKSERENLKIKFFKQDARDLPYHNQFDVAIMLCEGGFPLMETDEMNYEILKNVTKSLKDSGKFIFTTLNGLFPLFNSIDEFHETGAGTNEEGAQYKSDGFDLMTMRDYNVTSYMDDDGVEHKIECNERYYMPSEIVWLLKSLGFKKIDIFGAEIGAYSREKKLEKADFEMLVIAEK